MVDISLLRTFIAVYRAGSLTGAANELEMSQPTVTAHVKSLEEQFGQRLFDRLPRGVRPTENAHAMARQIGTSIDDLSALVAELFSHRDPSSSPVRLAGPGEFLEARVLPALADLVGDGLTLRVTTTLADVALRGLVEGAFDVVVSPVRPRARTVVATPLTDEEFVLVGAPEWARRLELPVARHDPAELAARFAEAPLLSYAEDLPILRRYWRVVFDRKLVARARLVVPDLRAVRAATVAGTGITVLPKYLCTTELESGSLVALLDPTLPPINTLYVATVGVPRRTQATRVRERLLAAARDW